MTFATPPWWGASIAWRTRSPNASLIPNRRVMNPFSDQPLLMLEERQKGLVKLCWFGGQSEAIPAIWVLPEGSQVISERVGWANLKVSNDPFLAWCDNQDKQDAVTTVTSFDLALLRAFSWSPGPVDISSSRHAEWDKKRLKKACFEQKRLCSQDFSESIKRWKPGTFMDIYIVYLLEEEKEYGVSMGIACFSCTFSGCVSN